MPTKRSSVTMRSPPTTARPAASPLESFLNAIVSWQLTCFVVLLTLFCSHLRGQEIDFTREVLPILRQHCIDCHGPESQESNLRLDSIEFALRGGDSGEVVIRPGHSDASHFVERLLTTNVQERMPLSAPPLSSNDIAVLKSGSIRNRSGLRLAKKIAANRPEHWSLQQ